MRYWRTANRDKVDDFLVHHGVDGQKWGVKHGPPYPLDRTEKNSKTIDKLNKRKAGQGKVADNYRKKKIKTIEKRIDKLNKKIYKDPEKENSKRNVKRKYEAERLNTILNDIKKASPETLFELRNMEWQSAMTMLQALALVVVHSDSNMPSLNEIINTMTDEQKLACIALIILNKEEPLND